MRWLAAQCMLQGISFPFCLFRIPRWSVIWLPVWRYRPSCRGRHGGRSLRPLVALHPQLETKEWQIPVLSLAFLQLNVLCFPFSESPGGKGGPCSLLDVTRGMCLMPVLALVSPNSKQNKVKLKASFRIYLTIHEIQNRFYIEPTLYFSIHLHQGNRTACQTPLSCYFLLSLSLSLPLAPGTITCHLHPCSSQPNFPLLSGLDKKKKCTLKVEQTS